MPDRPCSIPVSVIVVTKNEELRLHSCLAALDDFDDIWVVDSGSTDRTLEIAARFQTHIVPFEWNGAYPKKRQWCLEHLDLKYPWVFFVDADEIVTPFLVDELAMIDWEHATAQMAGYFVSGQYVYDGVLLQRGLRNRKLALFQPQKMAFPVVDDLDLEGMGEIEGHYQPVLKAGYADKDLGVLHYPVLHEAYTYQDEWHARHTRYACWEAGMNAKGAWPRDPCRKRQLLKAVFRALPFRGMAAFLYSYIFKQGFLDGPAGLAFARSRRSYYRMISDARKAQGRRI